MKNILVFMGLIFAFCGCQTTEVKCPCASTGCKCLYKVGASCNCGEHCSCKNCPLNNKL